MSRSWVRIAAGVGTFAVVTLVGVVVSGAFSGAAAPDAWFNETSANAFAVVLAIAVSLGVAVTFGLEYVQTGQLASISSQFGTRTIALMPLAIAINIVLGAAVANALKIPLYFDSLGTILVAVLCGPFAGALTGFLTNFLWSYVIPPPFQYPPAAAFAIVAVVIGLMAGGYARIGWFRPRPGRSTAELAVYGAAALFVVALLAYYAYTRFYGGGLIPLFNPDNADLALTLIGWVVAILAVLGIVGFFVLLIVRRDVGVAYVAVAGVTIGIAAAVISAPIAANVFGGVTGSGVDFLVAAFRQAGSDIQAATLQQGLLVDPIDKTLSSLIVYVIITAMARRTIARFPQGERLVAVAEMPAEAAPAVGS